ncbi:MAG: PHP domain-containing protein [Actinomycetota bacterium]
MDIPENDVIGELLRLAAAEESGHRRLALERAAHEAPMWPEEAAALAAAGRPLTELRSVGPWVAEKIASWLEDPPPAPEPDENRRGYLTWAKVRRVLADDPWWEATPHADLQVHSTASDGALAVDEMAEAARTLGRTAIASTDHSKSLKVARGMDEERLGEHVARIDAVNATYAEHGVDFRVLRSIEMDLFDQGDADMEPDALAGLDLVLGAFHSKLRVREDVTERYLAALRNPTIDVLAHPTTRMYGRRAGLTADWPRVFDEAARLGVAIELDATPRRQDLNVERARVAVAAGVRWFSMGSDAHAAEELGALPIAMATASLAGVPRDRILNYRSPDEIMVWAAERRG